MTKQDAPKYREAIRQRMILAARMWREGRKLEEPHTTVFGLRSYAQDVAFLLEYIAIVERDPHFFASVGPAASEAVGERCNCVGCQTTRAQVEMEQRYPMIFERYPNQEERARASRACAAEIAEKQAPRSTVTIPRGCAVEQVPLRPLTKDEITLLQRLQGGPLGGYDVITFGGGYGRGHAAWDALRTFGLAENAGSMPPKGQITDKGRAVLRGDFPSALPPNTTVFLKPNASGQYAPCEEKDGTCTMTAGALAAACAAMAAAAHDPDEDTEFDDDEEIIPDDDPPELDEKHPREELGEAGAVDAGQLEAVCGQIEQEVSTDADCEEMLESVCNQIVVDPRPRPTECSRERGHYFNPDTNACYCGALRQDSDGKVTLKRRDCTCHIMANNRDAQHAAGCAWES